MRKVIAALILWITAASPATAYEQLVHREITENAYDRLSFDFGRRLGIASGASVGSRRAKRWVSDGSHDEDNLIPSPRPLNHFFDPVHGVGLSVPPIGCAQVGLRADRWAYEGSGNDWSVSAARNYYRSVLLGPNPGTRNSSMVSLLLSLGHIAHLVQDMAQPEHTRNDQHLTFTNVLFGATAASLYEDWTLTNRAALVYSGYPTVKLPDYASYFHTDERDPRGRPAGRGLADFANRNFVTQDTNYSDRTVDSCSYILPPRCYDYDLPDIGDAVGEATFTRTEMVLEPPGIRVRRTFQERVYATLLVDSYKPGFYADEHHTSYSLLDRETGLFGCRTHSLTKDSYRARSEHLIPRAVGYSAGIIEHFFRGDIDVEWQPSTSGSYDVKITNRSSQTIGADARISANYRTDPSYFGRINSDDTSSIFRNDEIAALVPGFTGLAPNASVTIPNVTPYLLRPGDSITKFERRIAITATLGATPGEVIGLVQAKNARKEIRVEMEWSRTAANIQLWAFLVPVRLSFPYAASSPGAIDGPGLIPNSRSINPPLGSQGPATIIIEAEPNQTYYYFVHGQHRAFEQGWVDTVMRVYEDDALIQTTPTRIFVSWDRPTWVILGQYPKAP